AAYEQEEMHDGTSAGEFNAQQRFSATAYPVYAKNIDLSTITENSAGRLLFSTGANPLFQTFPRPTLLRVQDNGTIRAKMDFGATAPSVPVAHLLVGIKAIGSDDATPLFQDLGAGDLATLLASADLPIGPHDTLLVIGSTTGAAPDIFAVAAGQEGAQNSLSLSLVGLFGDSRLDAPATGAGAALHFYQQTSSGLMDLG